MQKKTKKSPTFKRQNVKRSIGSLRIWIRVTFSILRVLFLPAQDFGREFLNVLFPSHRCALNRSNSRFPSENKNFINKGNFEIWLFNEKQNLNAICSLNAQSLVSTTHSHSMLEDFPQFHVEVALLKRTLIKHTTRCQLWLHWLRYFWPWR